MKTKPLIGLLFLCSTPAFAVVADYRMGMKPQQSLAANSSTYQVTKAKNQGTGLFQQVSNGLVVLGLAEYGSTSKPGTKVDVPDAISSGVAGDSILRDQTDPPRITALSCTGGSSNGGTLTIADTNCDQNYNCAAYVWCDGVFIGSDDTGFNFKSGTIDLVSGCASGETRKLQVRSSGELYEATESATCVEP